MKLNLGCGYRPLEGCINIDNRIECNPDLVCDLNEGIPLKDCSVSTIRAHDIIEHIFPLRIINLFEEMYRVLKPNGELNILVPNASKGNGGFCDPTHVCYDEKTEILTDTGFKFFNDLDDKDFVYTLNLKNNTSQLEKPIKIIKNDYSGKMISWKGRHIDVCVTPNHRMIVRKHDSVKPFYEMEALDLFNEETLYSVPFLADFDGAYPEYFEIPNSRLRKQTDNEKRFIGDTIRLPIKPFMEFMGWWLSEGYVTCRQSSKDGGKYNFYRIGVCQSESANLEKYNIIGECIKNMGYIPYRDKIGWYFNDKELALYLSQFGKSHEKYIPIRLKQMHPELLEIMLTSLLLGDGTKNGNIGSTYSSISKQLASDVQEIAIKCGYRTTIGLENRIGKQLLVNPDYRAKYDMWHVYITQNGRNRYLPRNKEIIDYSGKIFCVSTKNGVVLIRRNGKVIWSGNSFFNKASFRYYTDDIYRSLYNIKAKFKQTYFKEFNSDPEWGIIHIHINLVKVDL